MQIIFNYEPIQEGTFTFYVTQGKRPREVMKKGLNQDENPAEKSLMKLILRQFFIIQMQFN